MRVNVDEKAQNDPRFVMLAQSLECRVRQAIGEVSCGPWMAALNRVSEDNPEGLLTRTQADHCSELGAAFIDAMIAAELAEVREDGRIYFAGIGARAKFLLSQRKRGSDGGKARSKGPKSKRFTAPQANAKQLLGSASSLSSGSGSGSGSVSGSNSLAADEPPPFALEPSKPKRQPVQGMRVCVAAFEAAYVARTGKGATWGKKQGGMLQPLVAKHGPAEVCKRIRVLFTSPPAFLAGSVPDLATLVQHFDKLAAPSVAPAPRPGPAMTGSVASTPVTPYKPPVVAEPVAGDAVRSLAATVLEKLKRNGSYNE